MRKLLLGDYETCNSLSRQSNFKSLYWDLPLINVVRSCLSFLLVELGFHALPVQFLLLNASRCQQRAGEESDDWWAPARDGLSLISRSYMLLLNFMRSLGLCRLPLSSVSFVNLNVYICSSWLWIGSIDVDQLRMVVRLL